MGPIKAGATFAAGGLLSHLLFSVSWRLAFVFSPLLVLIPLSFVVGGAVAGWIVQKEVPDAVPRLTRAYVIVGIGAVVAALSSGTELHQAVPRLASCFVVTFYVAGVAAKRAMADPALQRVLAWAFVAGGCLAAALSCALRVARVGGRFDSSMAAAILGWAVVGALFAVLHNRLEREPISGDSAA